jgi:hypothetical protein
MRDQQPASKRCWRVARFPIASVVAGAVVLATASVGSAATWTQQREFTSSALAGAPVALSGDGNTALVGAGGATFVYTRSGTLWKLQQKLAEGGLDWYGGDALSSDGNTALIGSYVFARSGTTWTQGIELIPNNEAGAVALSGDGNSALIMGAGSLYMFHRSGASWTGTQQFGGVGGPVTISSDGSTALAAVWGGLGAVVAFHWNGTYWTEQQELTDKNAAVDGSYFGTGVALNSNGSVAFIGGESESNGGYGAAFLFTRTGTQWTQKQTLAAANDIDGEPTVTAMSANGSVAMAAVNGPEDAYGTVYVFSCTTTTCVHQQAIAVKSQPNGYGNGFGGWVSLGSAGTTALIGTGQGSDTVNAAWVFTSG